MDRTGTLSYALSAVKQAESNEDLNRIIYELRGRYEVAHLAYHAPGNGSAGEPSDIFFATGNPEFCSRYLERGYVDVDPVIREARQSGMPVDWDTVDHSSTSAKRHFSEIISFEIGRRGMTIPCFTPDGDLGVLSYSTNHVRDAEWQAFRDERTPDLAYIILHFHAVAMRIAKGQQVKTKVKLTPQGKRLLALFVQGHTPTIIAHMTGLSIHTVRMHLDNVQARLGCKTKAEVIRKAIDLGLISKKSRILAAAFVVNFSSISEIITAISTLSS